MKGASPDGPEILANAVALEGLLREEAAENERLRQLSPRTAKALRAAGVFRLAMPAAWGGPEIDIVTQTEVVEALSRADGSAGWCAMIGSDGGFYSAFLDDTVGRALYPDLDAVTAGGVLPAGRLDRRPGGHSLSGRWAFGSGISHADVVAAGAIVFDDGEMVTGPDGRPEWRIALLPASAYEVLDTWYTTGLAGSGSHDYTADGVFVPDEQSFRFADGARRPGPLYAWPGLFIANATGVPLGIARAALDAARAIWADKMIVPDMKPARDEPRVRATVARAEAMVGSVRSYAYDLLASFWATLEAGETPSLEQRAALAGSFAYTFQTCRDAVALLYAEVGSQSVYRSCPLDRHLRDLATMSQHIMGQTRMLEMAGGMWLGQPSPLPVL
ncbi:MAG TPA: acyl-CoA dehydrogenase family protein [Acidimicrobiia bacterium]|nr:acyl-CoA dehydrogenase family protein [Acidimicrobiia bacterium]